MRKLQLLIMKKKYNFIVPLICFFNIFTNIEIIFLKDIDFNNKDY